jgi:hypothetical protein
MDHHIGRSGDTAADTIADCAGDRIASEQTEEQTDDWARDGRRDRGGRDFMDLVGFRQSDTTSTMPNMVGPSANAAKLFSMANLKTTSSM